MRIFDKLTPKGLEIIHNNQNCHLSTKAMHKA